MSVKHAPKARPDQWRALYQMMNVPRKVFCRAVGLPEGTVKCYLSGARHSDLGLLREAERQYLAGRFSDLLARFSKGGSDARAA